jgi:hypothetical protein
MAIIIGRCTHSDVTFQRAEPDVGIFSPYAECNDCGETGDIEEDYDVDEFEGTAHKFRYGVFPDDYDPEDIFCEVEGCEAEEVHECACGAFHCDAHPHINESEESK